VRAAGFLENLMNVSAKRVSPWSRISGALSKVSTAALWLAGAGLILMTAFVAWQVFGRYVLNSSPSWTEPGAVMLMSWFIFLGAAVGVRENYHLGFDVLLYVLPDGSKSALRTISDIAVAAFGLGMVCYGSQLVALTWASTLPSLGLPGGFDYLPVVAGGFLICLFSLERMARRFAGLDVDKDLNIDDTPEVSLAKEA
jgi:TRAP-type C4-dicarboxylate transport system permease small subunit